MLTGRVRVICFSINTRRVFIFQTFDLYMHSVQSASASAEMCWMQRTYFAVLEFHNLYVTISSSQDSSIV